MSTIPEWMRRWDRESALRLIRELQEAVSPHWHVGLTGSLLLSSTGTDLDLILYPSDNTDPREDFLKRVLRRKMSLIRNEAVIHRYWISRGITDRKRVEVYRYGDRRVDIMILS